MSIQSAVYSRITRLPFKRTNAALLLWAAVGIAYPAPTSMLTGRVVDPSGRAVPGANVMVRNIATLVERTVPTNSEGIFEIPALPPGSYRLQVSAPGFRLVTVEALTVEVARILVQDVRLELGDVSQEVTVKSEAGLIDGATTSVGHVIGERTVQEIPLNGRYFLDLAVMSPGSVTARRHR